jgi:hypothetical protein
MNETLSNFWPRESIGLPLETMMHLSPKARHLYNLIYDYCTYASDPQYQTLHKFRDKISKLGERDRDILIAYFNNDPAIKWNGMSCEPWQYYADPY